MSTPSVIAGRSRSRAKVVSPAGRSNVIRSRPAEALDCWIAARSVHEPDGVAQTSSERSASLSLVSGLPRPSMANHVYVVSTAKVWAGGDALAGDAALSTTANTTAPAQMDRDLPM